MGQAPTSRPLVSVIVVNYNGGHLLPECLASLEAQSYAPIEILIADNGSIDNSAEIAARYRCTFVGLGVNRGLPGAYNGGAQRAAGEYLFFVNNDMRFDATCVGTLVDVLDANPEIFAADPLQYNWEGDQVIHARTVMEGVGSAREVFSSTLIPVPPLKMNYTADSSSVVPVPWGSAGSLMVRRSLFETLGGWDESFFIDMEDVDLCWRAWLRGWPTVFVPGARLNHKWGASNDDQLLAAQTESVRRRLTRRDFDRLVRQQRNHLRFALKVLDPLSVVVLIGMKLVRLCALVPRYPRVAMATAVALAKFVGDIPVSLAARQRIAKTATSSSRAIIQRFRVVTAAEV